MPTLTLQVGQCGNQLGGAFWDCLVAQQSSTSPDAARSTAAAGGWWAPLQDQIQASTFFRHEEASSKAVARCLMIDTEPKVVAALLAADKQGVLSRRRCFLGQSGRGNNWAFGYASAASAATPSVTTTSMTSSVASPAWHASLHTTDPSQAEFNILEGVFDGIRREAEECDTAPDFLLLHSLGGGSGSGLGSRILEHIRQEYPLNYIASACVVPGKGMGDAPMHAINSLMALSFLQAYADVVLLFNNSDWLSDGSSAAARAASTSSTGRTKGSCSSLADVNAGAAACIAGALWPLDAADACGGVSRIRDLVSSVAPDACMKFVEARTTWMHANTPSAVIWPDAAKAVHQLFPRFDALDERRPITSAGTLLLARGFSESVISSHPAAINSYVKVCGAAALSLPTVAQGHVQLRYGAVGMVPDSADSSSIKASSRSTAATSSSRPRVVNLTAVSNRSSAVGLLSTAAERGLGICTSGAYMHWYEKYGCGADAVRHAADNIADVADCYRSAHGHTTNS